MVCTIWGKSIIPLTCSSEMRLKYISTAFLGHAHVHMDSAKLDEQSERGISKSSAEKGTCEKRIEVNDMRRCLLDNHVVYISVTGKRLRSLIRKWFSKR